MSTELEDCIADSAKVAAILDRVAAIESDVYALKGTGREGAQLKAVCVRAAEQMAASFGQIVIRKKTAVDNAIAVATAESDDDPVEEDT